MPRLHLKALQAIMLGKQVLFKHQLMNLVGISYEQLTAIITEGRDEVGEAFVTRLCNGLGCQRSEIVTAE